jgi:glutathione S-transferase
MSLRLYYHPLASFCHKVLIALYEGDTHFEKVFVDLGDPASSAPLFALWPLGKFPVIHDTARGQVVPETTVIIEYLDEHYPGAARMIPGDSDARMQARLWDRFFDHYVGEYMQAIVAERLRPEGSKDAFGAERARQALRKSYAILEARAGQQEWAAGAQFSMADCAAAPVLFFSSVLEPIDGYPQLAAYYARLMARPSVARVIEEAKPWLKLFPFKDDLPAHLRPKD